MFILIHSFKGSSEGKQITLNFVTQQNYPPESKKDRKEGSRIPMSPSRSHLQLTTTFCRCTTSLRSPKNSYYVSPLQSPITSQQRHAGSQLLTLKPLEDIWYPNHCILKSQLHFTSTFLQTSDTTEKIFLFPLLRLHLSCSTAFSSMRL